MRAYWWWPRGLEGLPERNFGDALTPLLLKHFGVKVAWSPVSHAEIVVCGSILETLPPDWDGIVLGSGFMHPPIPRKCSWDIRALRGRLSGEAPLYADPGLLAGLLEHPHKPREAVVGVLPHFVDKYLTRHFAGKFIDITASPAEVISQAGSCEKIVSSSLHGLILADSLGLPRKWEPCAEVVGNGFKFQDYFSVMGGGRDWHQADPALVKTLQDQLIKEFERL